jgi:hypothetical protein
MNDFTTAQIYNVPLFMYSMIGLTLGVITLSTVFDDTPDTQTSGIFQAPVETTGGMKNKTVKKKVKKHSRK